MFLTLGLAIVIGLLLGLLGGGGSILTVPMLVYVLHIEPKQAIVTSFVVVGISSLMALISHARRGFVCWKSGLFFGLAGMVGAFGGGRLAAHFADDILMALFGLVSLSTGLLMLRGKRDETPTDLAVNPTSVCPLRVPFFRVLFDGFFVGGLTGMVGVGGGFLIVPALTLLVGLPMQGAVGTSLLIIAMNAVAGLSGYSQYVALDWELTGLVGAGAIFGSAIGAWLSAYVKPALLRKAFGIMVTLVAAYVLSQAVSAQMLDSLQQWLTNAADAGRLLVGLLLLLLLLRIGHWVHKADAAVFTLNKVSKG
ncbi:sulfite exporter TauE/SafE family protein [Methylomonas sp. SURF-2]|uniref:Probable membrane transporter protein n=1 Tax=Methylomonas subterranea TaxID=2952225 RepID=A0ABT1TDL5_9GAMM|nr:sulfite exporter TauE/SafE family protein [Methylomonas sp. SURF-2]MCQ8103368.1 sulfite exporter TauE/SafE family protein [Methylomonas sp. SURF-2]